MNYRVSFTNRNARRIQVAVLSDQTENFQIQPNQTDSSTGMPEGQAFTFYWRDDGTPCRLCDEPECNANRMIMPSTDISLTLPDPGGRWPKQTN